MYLVCIAIYYLQNIFLHYFYELSDNANNLEDGANQDGDNEGDDTETDSATEINVSWYLWYIIRNDNDSSKY